jgi:ribosomal protein S18 acetylase RimI-like enzyme
VPPGEGTLVKARPNRLGMKLSTVVLNVRESNRAAIRVYEQLGFQTYCRYYEAIAFG